MRKTQLKLVFQPETFKIHFVVDIKLEGSPSKSESRNKKKKRDLTSEKKKKRRD